MIYLVWFVLALIAVMLLSVFYEPIGSLVIHIGTFLKNKITEDVKDV